MDQLRATHDVDTLGTEGKRCGISAHDRVEMAAADACEVL
jgi:hypothetical protein